MNHPETGEDAMSDAIDRFYQSATDALKEIKYFLKRWIPDSQDGMTDSAWNVWEEAFRLPLPWRIDFEPDFLRLQTAIADTEKSYTDDVKRAVHAKCSLNPTAALGALTQIRDFWGCVMQCWRNVRYVDLGFDPGKFLADAPGNLNAMIQQYWELDRENAFKELLYQLDMERAVVAGSMKKPRKQSDTTKITSRQKAPAEPKDPDLRDFISELRRFRGRLPAGKTAMGIARQYANGNETRARSMVDQARRYLNFWGEWPDKARSDRE